MNKCKNYRIKEFSFQGKLVYCPQRKFGWFWENMDYDGKGFCRLNNIPDHVKTRGEAIKIIEEEKAAVKRSEERLAQWKEHEKGFGKPKYYCAD